MSRLLLTRWSALLALVLSAACAELPKAPPEKSIFDFGLPADPLPGAGRFVDLALVVGMPTWMDERDMLYRLAWDDPQLRRRYATSRWAASPSQLLGLRWRQLLGTAQAAEGSICQLRIRVDEFSQVFSAEDASEAVLDAAVILVDARGKVLARQRLALREPAGVEARSGAAALARVADRAAGTLQRWLGEPAASGCF